MLPANLAKTRAAGRTAYGELVVLSGGATGPSTVVGSGGGGGSGVSNTNHSVRYTPYPLPATVTNQQQQHHHQQQQQHPHPHHHHQHHHHQQSHQTAHIIPIATPSQSILQYAPQASLYDAAAAVSYKRLLAATAAAATLRSHQAATLAHQPATTATLAAASAHPRAALTYPLNELLGLQGLDVSALYGLPSLGL